MQEAYRIIKEDTCKIWDGFWYFKCEHRREQIGYLLKAEEFDGNTIYQLGAKVYLHSDDENIILYLE